MIARRFALFVLFACLAAVSALLIDRLVQPSMPGDLLLAAGLGLLTGVPGFLHKRLGFLSLILLPVGAYVLLRTFVPLPELVEGWGAAYSYYLDELGDGLAAYSDAIFPLALPGVPGLKILVLLWVYLITAGAAVLALGNGRLLAGTSALLALLAFTFTVDDLSRDLQTVLAVLLVVVLLLLTAQALKRRRWGIGDLATGMAAGVVSVALSLVLLGGVPGLAPQGWQDWRSWDPFDRRGAQEIVFNWKQNYPRLLDPQNNFPVMRVTSPQPYYWRANTLEYFSGDAWLSEEGTYGLLPLLDGASTRAVETAEPVPPGEEVVQLFDLEGVSTTFLFTGGAASLIELDSPVSVYVSPAGVLRAQHALRPPLSYRVTAVLPRLRPADLVGKGRDYAGVAPVYLQLPFPTAAEIRASREAGEDWQARVAAASPRGAEFVGAYELNDRIVGETTDPYEIALRIERFLRKSYKYSLDLPRSDLRSPYAAFLFDTGIGYCQQFSGIMAMLLRLNGIPARIAVGFTPGKVQADRSFLVTTNNAHAWVEVYFPSVGWLPFDPTPGRNLPQPGVSSASAGFSDPFAHTRGNSSEAPPPGAERNRITETGESRNRVSPPIPVTVRFYRGAIVLASAVVLLLAWPTLRRWWREKPVRRGSAEDRLVASLDLLRRDLVAWAVPVAAAFTLEEVALAVKRQVPLDLEPAFSRAQRVLYGGREVSAADVEWLERTRRQVNRALGRNRGRLWRLVVAFGGKRFILAMQRRDRGSLAGRFFRSPVLPEGSAGTAG